jgi:PAS domain S-box-containing protein
MATPRKRPRPRLRKPVAKPTRVHVPKTAYSRRRTKAAARSAAADATEPDGASGSARPVVDADLTASIVDSLPVGLYVIDRNFTIVCWNRTREAGPFGLMRQDVIGRNLFEVLPSLKRSSIAEEFERVFATGTILQVEQETGSGPDQKHYRITKIPVKNAASEVTHVITVGEDITERRRMERQLFTSDKLAGIGHLAAGIAHELNNPMAAIASAAEAVLRRSRAPDFAGLADAEELRLLLRIIEEEVYRCKRIIGSLSDFSRDPGMERQRVDVREILNSVAGMLAHQARTRGVTLRAEHAPDLPAVLANEGELRQVFLALILNGLEAQPQGGVLLLKTRREGAGVVLEFTDRGPGIPVEHRTRLFQPFFTTKPPGQGPGLGLYVSYTIVTAHGGHLEVDSTPGAGTTVRIRLPAAPAVLTHAR